MAGYWDAIIRKIPTNKRINRADKPIGSRPRLDLFFIIFFAETGLLASDRPRL